VLCTGFPEKTRDTVPRTFVATGVTSGVWADGARTVERDTVPDERETDVVFVAPESDGITRETAPPTANASGAQIAIAKKHVSSFFILLLINYITKIHIKKA
jgi:hypothetical protein